MKKILLTLCMFALGAAAYAQTNARIRSDETSQPEIDNLSGLKPDEGQLEESGVVGLSNGETNTGTVGDNTDGYYMNGVKNDPMNTFHKDVTITTASLYPNPATDFITISTEVTSGTITILNILGQPLYSDYIQGTNTVLDISFLNEGIYFISLESGTEKIVKKLKVVN